MELEIPQIKEIIPHRFPFILIDRVIEIKPNEKLVAIKNVSINEHFFTGHFPEEKVMPGVLIVEAMAQAGCIYFHYSKNSTGKKLIYYLAKVTSKFHAPVTPGDQLCLEVSTIKLTSKGGFVKTRALVKGQLMAEAEVGFSVKECLSV